MVLQYWQQLTSYIIGPLLLIWLIITIYQNVRYRVLQALSFILLLFAILLNIGEYPGNMYIEIIGFVLAIIGFSYVFLGVLMAKRRWINRRGTKNLRKFSNLMIYAYIRHPVTWGMVIISIALVFVNHSILSNALAVIAMILLILSSLEKDLYMASLFGYPYRVYIETVPRFSLLYSIILRLAIKAKKK